MNNIQTRHHIYHRHINTIAIILYICYIYGLRNSTTEIKLSFVVDSLVATMRVQTFFFLPFCSLNGLNGDYLAMVYVWQALH